MNVREEERQKNACPGRGLGLAAAAIGVGVGAALYYIFSKRPENPDVEGSTSGWNAEQAHVFDIPFHDDSDSYITLSEHSTTDTSIASTDGEHDLHSNLDADSDQSELSEDDYESDSSDSYNHHLNHQSDSYIEISSDSEIDNEWDVTSSSVDMPEDLRSPMLLFLNRFRSPALMRPRNRERSWSLEECSICFDVILKDQQVTTLPCTHHFHSDCIKPWLQEQQTCPNCRKAAE